MIKVIDNDDSSWSRELWLIDDDDDCNYALWFKYPMLMMANVT